MADEYNIPEQPVDDISLLEPEATYSYADYLKWSFEERVELIKGKIFKMSPAPRTNHQTISMNLGSEIKNFLKGKSCKVFAAPFDVRLPKNSDDPDNKILTVVQPDICVICDHTKLDVLGCKGAPDLIIEILSPSTAKKDLENKFELYEENGVKEYWVVYPGENLIDIFDLKKDKYVLRGKFIGNVSVNSSVLPQFKVSLEDVFED
ncbi:Endonuclease, Uma2 family (restriction endonuclease fold) [Ekhidna lutea]|uniref:Endonuclease, Uma2 family (Restriction endonuclease fold) n=1 Tax=Ekhidna lutea TaxID=447679 RepID=A0A239IK52_EKHLU|nr:Uma2 family endonuclease [Ekhidna lutea]SNS93423.1 Endonuclease, Uma2 family (restriction endonuclease fold) [Ekhidna lutea]